ncbi:uncharacterized protein TRAVEDRAFT_128663 [Trametes versicolor FP-101664 SS1]|uniref:uncharacterized protein n=1 Tax=Trametes versicolor (strain FP-101664) TaxID=717944 RepID=UPI00046225CA|nr:uncharacterized protein TRAVEDRAFT_128663 [Trametes versicolor FP-101664 SS1]EIW56100.1 hypothetical protein TRAVEDRAFT_128663 [Trametes versicolor FP-101664 SS1]
MQDPAGTHQLLNDVLGVFGTLPWAGNIHGFENPEPLKSLATYVSKDWFSDVKVNQLLDLLRLEVNRRPEGRAVTVENLAFWRFLEEGYKRRMEPGEAYKTEHYFARAQGVGDSLAKGVRERVGLIVNLDGSHWIAVVVDFAASVILYGDSLRGRVPDATTLQTLRWWIGEHSDVEFKLNMLDITYQTNTFSCGLLSWNALAHNFLPVVYPLTSAADALDGRLHVLQDVIRRHLDEVRCHISTVILCTANTRTN